MDTTPRLILIRIPIKFQTKDPGDMTFWQSFTLSAIDLNEDPRHIMVSSGSLNEKISAGSVVASLSSTDADSS